MPTNKSTIPNYGELHVSSFIKLVCVHMVCQLLYRIGYKSYEPWLLWCTVPLILNLLFLTLHLLQYSRVCQQQIPSTSSLGCIYV